MSHNVLTRRSASVTAAALIASLTIAAVPSAAAAASGDRSVVLDRGHIDGFEVTYDQDEEELVLLMKDDTRIHDSGIVFRDPADVTLAFEDPRARITLPSGGQWAFLGDHQGAPGWIGTQTGSDQTYVPWVGWSTERLTQSLSGTGIVPAAGQPVSLAVEVEGPGDVFSFMNDAFGSPINRYVDTTDPAPNIIRVAGHAHVHTNWVFTEEGDYCLTVTPSLATVGEGTVTGPPALYHVRVGDERGAGCDLTDPIETDLTIEGLRDRYETGEPVELTAVQDPQTELDHYHWFTRASSEDEWAVIAGAGSETVSLTAGEAPALDGAEVIARLYDDEHAVVAESAPVTLDVVDPAPVETTVTIDGLRHHYHSGDPVELTAVQDPETEFDHYHWFTRTSADEDWSVVPGARDANITMTAGEEPALDGTDVIVRLYDDEHTVVAESDVVTIDIDDHDDHDHPVETMLTIEGLRHHYHSGDTARLTAVQVPETGLDHYHWFVTPSGGEQAIVPGVGGATYEFTVTAEWDGAEVVAKLYGDGHEVVAESDPVTIRIDDHDDPGHDDPGHDDPPTQPGFRDVVPGNPHADAIAELVARGITQGAAPGLFSPERSVTRGQLASFVARALELPAGSSSFADVPRGYDHAGAIAAMVDAGYVQGFTDGTFRPNDRITRDQIAGVLGRVLELDGHRQDRFGDISGSTHRAMINALADVEVARGSADGDYHPRRDLRRDQMASLLVRALQHVER